MSHNLKISIITVVYNGSEFLESTIKSVINQTYDNIEYIIIDGASTDGTVDIIKKYQDKIDYWVSEPDKGIYDAMNKGIERATGGGLLFLNAGDYFSGSVFNENITIPGFLLVKYINIFNQLVNIKIKNHKLRLPNCHQGIIFENKKIKYDLKYKVSSDYDYFLRHGYTSKLPVMKTTGFVYFDNDGYNTNNVDVRDDEIYNIVKKNYGFFYASLFLVIARTKKYTKKAIVFLKCK